MRIPSETFIRAIRTWANTHGVGIDANLLDDVDYRITHIQYAILNHTQHRFMLNLEEHDGMVCIRGCIVQTFDKGTLDLLGIFMRACKNANQPLEPLLWLGQGHEHVVHTTLTSSGLVEIAHVGTEDMAIISFAPTEHVSVTQDQYNLFAQTFHAATAHTISPTSDDACIHRVTLNYDNPIAQPKTMYATYMLRNVCLRFKETEEGNIYLSSGVMIGDDWRAFHALKSLLAVFMPNSIECRTVGTHDNIPFTIPSLIETTINQLYAMKGE